MSFFQTILLKIRGESSTEDLIKMGLKVGKNFHRLWGVTIDWSHCWLIEIGDNVTLSPGVRLIAHDASTKHFLGYTKIGKIVIGNNVYIGSQSVVLPDCRIGNNVIIGANSTITHDIPDNSVVAGSPARFICTTEEYLTKEKKRMETAVLYDASYTLKNNISNEKKTQMQKELKGIGYVE